MYNAIIKLRPDWHSDEDKKGVLKIVMTGNVDDASYAAVLSRWGEAGVVELTAVIGYYSMVAMTLNVHRVPLPDGVSVSLPTEQGALSEMPAAR